MKKSTLSLPAAAAPLALAWSVPAFAQSCGIDGSPASDDITVMARNRQESALKVPVVETGADNSFGDERFCGGEAGLKARLFVRALSLDTAFCYYKYNDLQVGANEVSSGELPILRTINAAASNVFGIDFQAS